jgi:hypothetical protein
MCKKSEVASGLGRRSVRIRFSNVREIFAVPNALQQFLSFPFSLRCLGVIARRVGGNQDFTQADFLVIGRRCRGSSFTGCLRRTGGNQQGVYRTNEKSYPQLLNYHV